jgi:hypothetical protein
MVTTKPCLTGDGLMTVRNDDNFKPRNFGEVIE